MEDPVKRDPGCRAKVSAAEALLRMKVLVGDEDAVVLGQCFQGLLQIEPDRSLAFVVPYMKDPESDVGLEAAFVEEFET